VSLVSEKAQAAKLCSEMGPASSPDRATRADDQDQEQLSRLEDVFAHLGKVAPMSIEGSPRHTG
jgi:hypothetical protein